MCYNPPVFAKLYVEITDVCNLRCSFCPPTGRPRRFMSRAEFAHILKKLEGQGRLLYLHVKGEPLLHPKLGELLSIAGDLGFGVALTTNGSLLEKQASTLLGATALRKLSISLHSHAGAGAGAGGVGTDAAGTDAGAGAGAGDVDAAAAGDNPGVAAYWSGVASFLDLHRQAPPFPVSLRLWNLRGGVLPPETAYLVEKLRERYPNLGPRDGGGGGVGGGGAGASLDGGGGGGGAGGGGASASLGGGGSALAWPKALRLDTQVFLNAAEEFTWPDPALPEGSSKGSCLGLRKQIAVLVDGTLVPCCLDGEGRIPLGNLFEQDLDEILAGERARAMRQGFERNALVESLCRTCGYRSLYREAYNKRRESQD